MKLITTLITLSLLLAGCAALHEGGWLTPPPASSTYFITDVGGFTVNTKAPDLDIHYILTLQAKKPFGEDVYLVAQFEDPQNPRSFIVVDQILPAGETKVSLKSPKVQNIKSYEGYKTIVNVYADQGKTDLLGTHEQVIQSIFDDRQLLQQLNQR